MTREPVALAERAIFAMGGGGFTMEPANPLLDDFVLSLPGAVEPKILFLPTASGETSAHLNPQFNVLFDEMLKSRVDALARDPQDLEQLVEAVTIYHMIIEGMLALTGQHFIIDYNERVGTLPAFVEGFTNVARDEHRHVAFGARFLRDMATQDSRYGEAIQRTLAEVGPVADGVLRPK